MEANRRHRRKRRGEGTVYKRDGFWASAVSLGKKPNGKRKRVVVYGKTIAELNAKMARAKREAAAGDPIKDRETNTVADLCDRWLAAVKPSVSAGTHLGYESHVRLHIKPYVGAVKLKDLRVGHVEHLVAELAKERDDDTEPVSAAMIRKVFTTLRAAMSHGVDKDLLTRNPSDLVRKSLPRRDRKSRGTLTPNEARALLAAVDGDRLAALIDVGLDSGCRMGELLALRWKDYNEETGVLSVTKSLADVNGKLVLKDVKTGTGVRSVVLSFARPPLAAHRERMLDENRDVVAG